MSTLNRYQGIDEILHLLDGVSVRRWMLRLAAGISAVITIVCVALLAAVVAGGYWHDQPPVMLRWIILIGFCAVSGAAAWWFVARRIFGRRQNPARTARIVEQASPGLQNHLINAVQLAADADQKSPHLVQKAIDEAVGYSRYVDPRTSLPVKTTRRWALAAAIAVIVLAGFALLQKGPFLRGLAAMQPTRYVPTYGSVELVKLLPGDATCFVGDRLAVVVQIRNDDEKPLNGRIIIENAQPQPMTSNIKCSVFTAELPPAAQSFRYAVQIGDTRWPLDRPYYNVKVVNRVDVEAFDIDYTYPPYTGMAPRKVSSAGGHIEAPAGSKATIELRLSAPAPQVQLEIKDNGSIQMAPDRDDRTFSAELPIDKDGEYRIVLRDRSGGAMQYIPDLAESGKSAEAYSSSGRSMMNGYFSIRAIADEPPKVRFLSPGCDIDAPPGGTVKTRVEILDDHGLTEAVLLASREGEEPKTIHRYAFGEKKQGRFDFEIRLDDYRLGDTVVYFAAATDNRNLPGLGGYQTTKTPLFKIAVRDPAVVAAERAKRFEQLRQRLAALLAAQQKQRLQTEQCRCQPADLKGVTAMAKTIVEAQKSIRSDMQDIVEHFDFEPEMLTIQQGLALLSVNEAALAIQQAGVLAALENFDARQKPCEMLADTQDKIIDALQTMLAILPALARGDIDSQKQSAAGDLSDETKEKLRQLQSKLEEFVEEHKKVIEASQRLAKKPVDDFTEEDKKLLEELRAIEDKWEKFLEEAITDFSRLAEQDFSNPALLKELMSVKSDVTMAKNALANKAAEIATACEENGIENAETLTANIEKWLSDKPDREKWDMEDPTGQENIEQAELPTELEDLVGDLLEEEEDLLEEVEDVSSKYTMSGDKGIGWDAVDGPISNMNAQGVTGNQLPNNDEVGGRSGEGRQGKSSGEHVEDKAVGKGGRETPTRLGEEPYQKGQVKDTSTEPAGGATGGGKTSGAGGEGLEGPVPPPMQQELDRLAGKQAALVNRAERIRANFKQSDYSGFKLDSAVTLMKKNAEDLKAGRYKNVLRQRNVLISSLKQTALLLGGMINVRSDKSTAMTKQVRDNVADTMQDKMPEDYKDVMQQYYRRMSESD